MSARREQSNDGNASQQHGLLIRKQRKQLRPLLFERRFKYGDYFARGRQRFGRGRNFTYAEHIGFLPPTRSLYIWSISSLPPIRSTHTLSRLIKYTKCPPRQTGGYFLLISYNFMHMLSIFLLLPPMKSLHIYERYSLYPRRVAYTCCRAMCPLR